MSNKIDITIPAEGFTAAGKAAFSDFSLLSPFNIEPAGSLQKAPKEIMRGNKVREDLLPALQTLAQTQAMGACAYLGSGVLVDVSFYYPADASEALLPVSLSMAEDGIRLQSPADVGMVAAGLGQLIGSEMVRICDFEAELSFGEALVLFGLVDAARRQAFTGLAGSTDKDLDSIPTEEVAAALSAKMDEEIGNLQWLAPHFAEIYDIEQLSLQDIENNLRALAKKKLLNIQGKIISMSDGLTNLVANFFTVSGHLRLQAAHLDSKGNLQATEVRGIRGQDNALLLWTEDGKNVQFMGASPAQVLAIVRDILGSPDGSRQPAATASEQPVIVDDQVNQKSSRKKKVRGGKKGRWWKTLLIIIISLVALWIIVYSIYSFLYY